MRSKLLILTLIVLSIAFVGQAFAAATVSVVPANVPKGAYVNGGGVADNDNAYYQQVKVEFNDYHPDCGVFTLYFPTGAYLADPDGDTILSEDITVVYEDAATETTKLRYFGTNANKNELYFVYFTGDGTDLHPPDFPNGNESFYISFPIVTDLNPGVTTDDYYVTFGNPTGHNFKVANLSIANGEIVSEAIAVGDYVKGQTAGLGVVAALYDAADDVIRVVYDNAVPFANPENVDTVLLYPESGYDVVDGFVAATDAASTGYETDRMALMAVADLTGFAVGTYVAGATAATVPGAAVEPNQIGVVTALYNAAVPNDSLYIVYSGPDFVATDDLLAQAAPDFYNAAATEAVVSVSDIPSILDNIASGSGAMITYATDRQQLYSSAVTFSDNFKANNDTTSTHGQKHPANTAVFATALPNLVYDGAAGTLVTDNTGYFGFTTNNSGVILDGTDNNATADAEVKYYVWAAQDSTLEYVWSSLTGVVPVLVYDPIAYKGYIPEADAATTGLATSNVPEGTWFFYVTSSITGRHILARSGSVIVRHWPYVKTVGWDYDGNGIYNAATDNSSVTLDSGLYYGYDNIAGGATPRKDLDIYASVDDYDNNASIKIFYSTSGSLTSTAITTSGESPNLVVTGLTGATALSDTTLFDDVDEDVNGYAKVGWDVAPSGKPFIPANPYYIYVVANDGKHQDILVAKGNDATTDIVTARHSPNLVIDALTEYNNNTLDLETADVTIDASRTDVVMLSWGKTGVTGDADIDNSSAIEFYIDYDNAQDGTPDYLHNAAATLRTDAANSGNAARGPHRIVASLQEDPESKALSYFAWDLANDFAQTGWRPEDQETSTSGEKYHLYAVMDEGGTGIQRVFVLGGFADPNEINFARVPFTRLIDPPYNGITVNSDETFRLRYDAFDPGTRAQVGVFLLKDDEAINSVTHPLTAKMYQMWGATNGKTYALTDNNGWVNPDVAAIDGSWLNESPYPAKGEYSATLRLPSQKDKTVVLDAGPKVGAADLAAFTAGSYVTALNGATGLVINVTEAAGAGASDYITVSYTGQDFTTGAAQLSPGATYNAGTAIIINLINGPAYGKYVYSMNGGANGVTVPITYSSLSDGTWWPYIAVDDSSYYKVRVTVAAMAGLDPGDYVYSQTTLKVGRVIAEPAAGTQFDIVYPGPGVFAGAENMIEITNPSDVTTTSGAAALIGAVGTAVPSNNFTGWNITLYRAPGPLKIVNADETASQKNLMLTPVKPVVALGDTITFSVRAADENHAVDLVDLYIAIEKEYFDVVNTGAPFTDTSTGTLGSLIANTLIDDVANNRYILHTTVYNSSNPINPDDWDLGSELCTFKVVSKGTNNAVGASSSVYFVNEPARGWSTVFSNDGTPLYIGMSSSTVDIQPRGIIEGIVQFEGRTTSDYVVNLDLRKRGSYVACTDTAFYNLNDGAIADSTYKFADISASGIQYKLDKDGKFRLFKVPTGEWDLVVSYNRYLAKLQQVSIYPGLDTLFVSFGQLLGGDAVGYVDSSGAAWPNNVINSSDITRISDAYLDTPDSTRWNDGVFNYKWADINEDLIVSVEDLTMATANYTGSPNNGAQPVYQKPAAQPVETNANAFVEFVNLPATLQSGQRYTVQIVARNAADVKGYFVNLAYDRSTLSLAGIQKGGFLEGSTCSFPTLGNGTVGLTNTVYGAGSFSGDGVLAEVTFTATRDGVFSANMIGFTQATFVNSEFAKETVIGEAPIETAVESAPSVFALGQNFPNPFNPTTTINYSIPKNSLVSIQVFDILGQSVRTLVDQKMAAGTYSVVWDARNANGSQVSAGVYFYRIKADSFSSTKRMLLLK